MEKYQLGKLINITVESIIKQSLIDRIDDIMVTRLPTLDNIWNEICFKYYGKVEYVKACRIYMLWKRNAQDFSNICKTLAKNFYYAKFSSNNLIIIPVKNEEWNILQTYKSFFKERCKFNIEFTNWLSQKLQDHGIYCWLRCKSNWFKQDGSRKQASAFWKGTYECTSKCGNIYEAFIVNQILDKSVMIFVTPLIQFTHIEKVPKRLRCSSSIRENQAKNILLNGFSSAKADNVLHNFLNPKQNGKMHQKFIHQFIFLNFLIKTF